MYSAFSTSQFVLLQRVKTCKCTLFCLCTGLCYGLVAAHSVYWPGCGRQCNFHLFDHFASTAVICSCICCGQWPMRLPRSHISIGGNWVSLGSSLGFPLTLVHRHNAGTVPFEISTVHILPPLFIVTLLVKVRPDVKKAYRSSTPHCDGPWPSGMAVSCCFKYSSL